MVETTKTTAPGTNQETTAQGQQPPALRVLVIDGAEASREQLLLWLRDGGHQAVGAAGGRDALVRLASEPFDLVLLDLTTKETSRLELLSLIKKDTALQQIRVMIIAGADATDALDRGIEIGADDFLTRPMSRSLLQARLRAVSSSGPLSQGERRRAESMERELEIGREIQAGFLPDSLPPLPGWEIDARLRPAREVSGDFYDAFAFEAGGRVGLIVADVCDKGVGAALYMALFRTLLRAAAVQRYSGLTGRGTSLSSTGFLSVGGIDAEAAEAGRTALASALKVTNNYIALTHPKSNMFATVFFAVLDPLTGTLDYANCGHEPPVVLGPTGLRQRLGPTSLVLGAVPDLTFEVSSIQLNPGDTLLAFTDGIAEASSPDGQQFDSSLDVFLNRPAQSATELLDRLETAVESHTGGAPQADDITLLAVRRLSH